MFDAIIATSLRQRLLVLGAALLLMAWGALSLQQMHIDVFPDLDKPMVTLMTEAPGMAPEEVEQLITRPLEAAMNGIPGIQRVRSVSGIGLSLVHLEFAWGSDIHLVRQQASERLGILREQLPEAVQPQLGAINSIMGEILLLAIPLADGSSPMVAREVADWHIRPQLQALPGVSQITVMGGEVRQFQVRPLPAQMALLEIGLEQLEAALRGFAQNTSGGFLDDGSREYLIRHLGRTTRLEDLRQLVVDWHDGRPVLLHQVADVAHGAAEKRGEAGFNGAPAIILSVQKQPGVDTVRLTAAVEQRLAAMASGLPDGIRQPHILFRQGDFISAAIGNVGEALRDGAIMVTVVLFLLLLNVRTTLIALSAIPLSLLMTVLVFRWFDLSINTMTLGGLAIAIGELIDDAVVGMENVFRRLRQRSATDGPARQPVLQVIAAATSEVRSGIVYATAIVVLVFVPLFLLPGLEGRLFTPLGIAYIVSILASMITAVTLTPVLCYYLLPQISHLQQTDSPLVRVLKRLQRALLLRAFVHPRLLLVTALAVAALAAASVPWLPRAFLPDFNEGTLTISVLLNPGTSLSESGRVGQLAERLLLEVPEVVQVGRRTGRAEQDDHAEGVHSNELEVDLRPLERPQQEVLADIRQRLAALPASISIGQPISHRLDHLLSGIQAQIVVKIFGDDLDVLRGLAGQLQAQLQQLPGLVDVRTEKQSLIPQKTVRPDAQRAAAYGINPAAILAQLERLVGGTTLGQVIDGQRRFDLVLRLEDTRRQAEALERLLIETPAGPVPLAQLATVTITSGPNQISRDDGQRRIVVAANSAGGNLAEQVAGVRRLLTAQYLPEGYFHSLEGQFQAQEDATRLIALLGLLSLLLIGLILYSRYRSWRLTAMILANIPLALIGAVAALWLTGVQLSVATMIGFITLAGIATRNGILKVSHYLNLALFENEPFGRELIVRGALERLTPVLMTAVVTAIALVPLLLAGESPGKEILHPVAVVIFGGLVSATLLDAILTPLMFWLWGERPLQQRLREQADAMTPSTTTY